MLLLYIFSFSLTWNNLHPSAVTLKDKSRISHPEIHSCYNMFGLLLWIIPVSHEPYTLINNICVLVYSNQHINICEILILWNMKFSMCKIIPLRSTWCLRNRKFSHWFTDFPIISSSIGNTWKSLTSVSKELLLTTC